MHQLLTRNDHKYCKHLYQALLNQKCKLVAARHLNLISSESKCAHISLSSYNTFHSSMCVKYSPQGVFSITIYLPHTKVLPDTLPLEGEWEYLILIGSIFHNST